MRKRKHPKAPKKPEPPPPEPPTLARRACLGAEAGCPGWLWSEGNHHRICGQCRSRRAERLKGYSPRAMRPVAGGPGGYPV